MRLSGGVDTAADALEDETEDVEGDEEPCVEAGIETGEVRAYSEGDVLEGEVDAGADEGGRQDQADDLDLEAVGRPRVVVQDDAADIACRRQISMRFFSSLPFSSKSQSNPIPTPTQCIPFHKDKIKPTDRLHRKPRRDSKRKRPRLPTHAHHEGHQRTEPKHDRKEDIGAQIRGIAQRRRLHGTLGRDFGTECEVAGGHGCGIWISIQSNPIQTRSILSLNYPARG